MTLIKLKDDEVTSVLPVCSRSYSDDYDFDECWFSARCDGSIIVQIEFEDSEDFDYRRDVYAIDESNVSEIIRYLFSDVSRFSELTAEEFKENLKRYLDRL